MSLLGEVMLKILALDPRACLRFSTVTKKWYIDSTLFLTNGSVQSGMTQHHVDPEEAVHAYWLELTKVDMASERRIGIGSDDKRRHYYWNGAAFTEEPVSYLAGSRS